MRLAYLIILAATLALSAAGCGDDDFGSGDGPSASVDFAVNADVGTVYDLTSVDLAHD